MGSPYIVHAVGPVETATGYLKFEKKKKRVRPAVKMDSTMYFSSPRRITVVRALVYPLKRQRGI